MASRGRSSKRVGEISFRGDEDDFPEAFWVAVSSAVPENVNINPFYDDEMLELSDSFDDAATVRTQADRMLEEAVLTGTEDVEEEG